MATDRPRSFSHTDGRFTHDVYVAGPKNGKRVILLHELDGLNSSCLQLMQSLAGEGFKVYTPSFFEFSRLSGTPAAAAGMVRVCISREFHVLVTRGNSPAAAWIRSLAAHISENKRKVGIVGMCMTGGLALAAVAEESVAAAVVAQPSMPLAVGPWPIGNPSRRSDLALSEEEARSVQLRAVPVLALRFDKDPLSPIERIFAIDEIYNGCVRFVRDGATKVKAHATLTAAFRDEDNEATRRASQSAIEAVVKFLDANL